MVGLVIGILMFMSLVLIHELGHFIAAKKSGVKVLEFGIGIPPKACKLWTDKSGTEYTLNWIPLGGFVRLKGEDPKVPDEFNAKDSLIKANIRRKLIIMVAGVFMNFLLAWILFTAIFTAGVKPISIIPENALVSQSKSYLMPTISFLDENGFVSGDIQKSKAIVETVMPDMLGSQLGILSGDIISQINETPINTRNIGRTLQNNIGKDIQITINRNDQTIIQNGKCPDDQCLLGISIVSSGNIEIKDIKAPFKQAIVMGLQEIKAETNLTLNALGKLGKDLLSFNGKRIKESVNKLAGPAGAIKFGDKLIQEQDWMAYLGFAGIISLALAIFNILPIPALDGGRILGSLIQRAGRFKAEKYFNIEGYINLVFFILLMGLGIYILFKDLIVFWGVNIPFIS
ncbi:MAG: site-2 protease family protein [Candidatus Absconditicoccaceae bacterium]